MTRSLMYRSSFFAFLATGCAADWSPPDRSTAVAIVLDRSTSMGVCRSREQPKVPRLCDPEAGAHLLTAAVQATGRPAGLEAQVIQLTNGLSADRVWHGTLPGRADKGSGLTAGETKEAWLQQASQHISAMTGTVQRDAMSHVAAGAWTGTRQVRESGAATKLLLLHSDLREWSTAADFVRATAEPTAFLASLQERRALPDLTGVHVLVCGVHHEPLGKGRYRWTPERHHALIASWTAVFEAANAASFTIREDCSVPSLTRALRHALAAETPVPAPPNP